MEAVTDCAHRANVRNGDRLPTAGVVRDGHEDHRHVAGAFGEELLERADVHVPFERVHRSRLAPLRNEEIHRFRPCCFDVRARRVEVRVVGNDLAGARDDREENALRRAALVRRDDVAERKELLHRLEETEPRRRPRVALVPVLDRGPLVARHGAGPRIGQEIDEHVLGAEREEVVSSVADLAAALVLGRHAQRLDRVDAEGLDDRFETLRHRVGPSVIAPGC